MKKFIAIALILLSFLTLSACQENPGLERYVSELRSNLYVGECESFTVKGGYGFKESPYHNDGKVGACGYYLTLKLVGKETSQTTYTANLSFNDQKYSAEFKLNPITHSLIASVELEGFDLNEFNVDISYGDTTQTITMNSILPKETLTYVEALSRLEQSQPELIKAFSDSEGNFNAEIYARVIVKNDKAFWYIGLAGGNDLLKALLIDGATGEVLAIREII